MRIRLAVTLDIRKEPPEMEPQRETDVYSTTELSDDRPPIGFRPRTLDPEEMR